MANFAGHSAASAAIGIIGAIYLHEFGHQPSELATIAVVMAGYFGGLAPDIDLGGWKQASIPNKMAKAFSAAMVVYLSAQHKDPIYVAYGALAWVGAWVLIDNIMAHRGHTHSWLGAACFALFLGWVAGVIAGGNQVQWFATATAFAGYMGHLLLDDWSSSTRAILKGKKMKPALVSIRPFYTGGNWMELVLVLGIGYVGLQGIM